MYKLVGLFGDDSEHPVFDIEIKISSKVSNFTKTISVFATQQGVDETAIALSKAMPYATINISCFARIKATYKNGIRIIVRDLKDFYSDLSDEQYKATQFKCSTTHQMV